MCFHGEYRGKISTFYLQGRRFEVGGYLCPGCSIFDLQIAVVVFTKQLANIQPQSKMLGMVAFLCVIWTGGFLQTVFVKPLSIIRYGKQQTIVTQGKRDCHRHPKSPPRSLTGSCSRQVPGPYAFSSRLRSSGW